MSGTCVSLANRAVSFPPQPPRYSRQDRILLADAVEQYLSDKAAEGKDHKTISAYRFALAQFTASCSKKFIDEIGKAGLEKLHGWLRLHAVPNRRNANPGQTYKNKVLYVVIFLKAFGREKLLKKSEYPSSTSKIVSAHTTMNSPYFISTPRAMCGSCSTTSLALPREMEKRPTPSIPT